MSATPLPRDGYFYNKQFTKYILQFMAVFSEMHVMFGKTATRDEALVEVPVKYGKPDRVVAAIQAGNTQNAPLRLPMMSAYMTNWELDTPNFHGLGVERRNTYTPMGGLVPNDMVVVQQRMPLQIKMTFELNIWASNENQLMEIEEQFAPHFNPSITIQTSDSPLDMTRMTSLKLVSRQGSPFPVGQDRRLSQSTFTFEMPGYLDVPAKVHKQFIEKVFIRIGNVSNESLTNYEIVADLDGQQIPYDEVQDGSNLKIDE